MLNNDNAWFDFSYLERKSIQKNGDYIINVLMLLKKEGIDSIPIDMLIKTIGIGTDDIASSHSNNERNREPMDALNRNIDSDRNIIRGLTDDLYKKLRVLKRQQDLDKAKTDPITNLSSEIPQL